MNSMEPSVEPLSETMTSNSVECVPAKIDRRQSAMTVRSFQQRMTTDNFMKAAPECLSHNVPAYSPRAYRVQLPPTETLPPSSLPWRLGILPGFSKSSTKSLGPIHSYLHEKTRCYDQCKVIGWRKGGFPYPKVPPEFHDRRRVPVAGPRGAYNRGLSALVVGDRSHCGAADGIV